MNCMNSLNQVWTRREFLRDGVRYAALGALAVVSARVGRHALPSWRDPRCTGAGLCGGCAVFAQCGLPAALSARQSNNPGG
jgi:hypothetical protein